MRKILISLRFFLLTSGMTLTAIASSIPSLNSFTVPSIQNHSLTHTLGIEPSYRFKNWINELNLHYIQKESYIGHSFKKITVGLGTYSESFQANSYNHDSFFSHRTTHPLNTLGRISSLSRNPLDRFQKLIGGYDVELDARIPFPWWHSLVIRLSAGGYHFYKSSTESVLGPKGRLELLIQNLLVPGDRFTMGGAITHDSPRGTQQFFHFGLRVPFQHKNRKSVEAFTLESRYTEKVKNDMDGVNMASHRLGNRDKLTPFALREKIKAGLETSHPPPLKIPKNLQEAHLQKPTAPH